jgi:hypothetical protein
MSHTLRLLDYVTLARENGFDLWYNPFDQRWTLTDREDRRAAMLFTRDELLSMNMYNFGVRYLLASDNTGFFDNRDIYTHYA